MLEHPRMSNYYNNLFKIGLSENVMTADNQQGRTTETESKYRLHYSVSKSEIESDGVMRSHDEYRAHEILASSDEKAIEQARMYLKKGNRVNSSGNFLVKILIEEKTEKIPF